MLMSLHRKYSHFLSLIIDQTMRVTRITADVEESSRWGSMKRE